MSTTAMKNIVIDIAQFPRHASILVSPTGVVTQLSYDTCLSSPIKSKADVDREHELFVMKFLEQGSDKVIACADDLAAQSLLNEMMGRDPLYLDGDLDHDNHHDYDGDHTVETNVDYRRITVIPKDKYGAPADGNFTKWTIITACFFTVDLTGAKMKKTGYLALDQQQCEEARLAIEMRIKFMGPVMTMNYYLGRDLLFL